jgi:hypothetical protein
VQLFRSRAKRRSAEPRRRRRPLADRELEGQCLGPTLHREIHRVPGTPQRKLTYERFCRNDLSTINSADDGVPNTINEFFARTLAQP